MKQAALDLNLSTKKTRKREFLKELNRVLFALSNLWMARRRLMAVMG